MAFNVTYNGETKTYEKPTSVLEIVGDNKEFVCVRINKRVRELTYIIEKDCEIETLTVKDRDAIRIYEGSLRYLTAMALHNINPELRVRFSYNVSRALFIQILNPKVIATTKMSFDLLKEMNRLVDANIPFNREKLDKEEAIKIYKEAGYLDKIKVLGYGPEKTAHLYECNGYRNYMYERMVPSTGYLTKFKIKYYSPGIILQYPRSECGGEIPEFKDAPMYGRTLKRAHNWASNAGLDTVIGINETLKEFGPIDLINMCEHQHNHQFSELGDLIEQEIESVRLICVAGPSSSGKTTFANRLRIELLSRGIRPIRISIDDYYLPREQCPIDEDGKVDLEHINALDVALFNKNMSDLIEGLEVTLPRFNFQTGKREDGRTLKLEGNQPIIIEGIHALNDELTPSIPRHQKYKIFIAPHSQLNIDNDTPMSLTNLRLLRRIVRDFQFRNSSALETLSMWDSVRKGEFKWIYENQEGVDYTFNSVLSYELCAMKKYALPLLSAIDRENEYFPVAERLIRMLKFFDDLPDEWVPCNSLLREFIGGSCYADV